MGENPTQLPHDEVTMASDMEIRDYLIQEIAELTKQIQEYTHGADKYFGIATTVIVAAITLSISNKVPAALIALPFAVSGILLYVMQLFTERAARMGMRRSLEKHLREHFGYWLAAKGDCFERAVNQSRLSVRFSTGLYIVAYLGTCTISTIRALNLKLKGVMSYALPGMVILGLIIMAAAMVIAYDELAHADEKAFDDTEARRPAGP
jgi:small-conductance mechanosensitive channel